MVDQTKMSSGGEEKSVIHNFAEFLSDVFTLTELQMRLFAAEAKEGLEKLTTPVVVLLAGAVVLLSCLPMAMVAFALLLTETTRLTPAQAFFIVLGVGVVLGLGLLFGGLGYVRGGLNLFSRSLKECTANTQWIKGVLLRLSQPTPPPGPRTPSERIPERMPY